MPDHCNGLLIVSKNAIYETPFLNTDMVKLLQLDTQADRKNPLQNQKAIGFCGNTTKQYIGAGGRQLFKRRLRIVINFLSDFTVIYTKTRL